MRQSRRDFLRYSGLGATGALLHSVSLGGEPLKPLNVRRVVVDAGVGRTVSVLHVSDSHLARIDSRESEDLYAFAKSRSRIDREFGEYYLDEAVHYARDKKIKIIHTGDFVDFRSEANLEYAERRFCTDNFLACVGNHEYWMDAVHRETEKYKEQTIPRLKEIWSGIPASTHCVNGINFFVFDNSFGVVTQEIYAEFERAAGDRLPIVMVCHVPLWAEGCGMEHAVCGMPGRRKDDEVSCAFVERAWKEPLVKAVLAGHVHAFRKFAFSPTATEFVAGALFNGDSVRIDIV